MVLLAGLPGDLQLMVWRGTLAVLLGVAERHARPTPPRLDSVGGVSFQRVRLSDHRRV